jgi:hypothetical protein
MAWMPLTHPFQRLPAADLVRSGSGQRRRVRDEVTGDDLVGDVEVAVPQVFPRAGERGVGCVGHGGFLSWEREIGLRAGGRHSDSDMIYRSL